ncbi:septum formation initiator family protein [Notoacmeibacter sp. MSK16QG-6]|uniref:FtsB family cell division protein n=1 Tax=Notoacmeibacter sp. MSK16QG-6 TaxID=2957982 RepID=UPI00209EBE7F|nr:septum formation initiator family protein [Notoacmeibacter sp. MSK16QG-6]MCP1200772.1 septum formation initiator family protein [Notoacmeibacter sp. MSK16QG-6]
MWTRQYRRKRWKGLVLPVLTGLCLVYFSHHTVQGDYGTEANARHEARLAELQDELAALSVRHGELEKRAIQLQDGTISRDMLDEMARRQLGVIGPNELIIRP